jgi:hypothetical protein
VARRTISRVTLPMRELVKLNCSTASPVASTVTALSSMPLARRRKACSRSAGRPWAEQHRLALEAGDALRLAERDVVVARERADRSGSSRESRARGGRALDLDHLAVGQVAAHVSRVRTISRGTPSSTSSFSMSPRRSA